MGIGKGDLLEAAERISKIDAMVRRHIQCDYRKNGVGWADCPNKYCPHIWLCSEFPPVKGEEP